MTHILAVACYAAGVLITVVASLAMLLLRGALNRLHLVTLTTTLGVPLVGLGLCLQNGWSMTTATVVLCCVVLTASGPVLTAAAGRVAAQRAGLVEQESPK
ncbi:MAG TPA: monovalent cation/H(+) antiporter subunit G [Nocardioidaceae bacterium]|nr:monovalent cation/H(+) antiporter subunit G [Nocardioidaceae bacterium]